MCIRSWMYRQEALWKEGWQVAVVSIVRGFNHHAHPHVIVKYVRTPSMA